MPVLPRAFDLSRWSYMLDFAVMPLLAAALLATALLTGLDAWVVVMLLAAGALLWSLVEYLVHRFVFHGVLVLRRMHDEHHRRPLSWIGVPTWYTLPMVATLAVVLSTVLGPAAAEASTAGVVVGYLVYCAVHVCYHHAPSALGRYGRFMASHHGRHHRGARGNYGVSSPLWDLALGTYRRGRA